VKATEWKQPGESNWMEESRMNERPGGDVKNWRIGDRKTETGEPDGKLGESNGGQLEE